MRILNNISIVIFIIFCSIQTTIAQDTLFDDVAVSSGIQDVINGLNYGVAWGDFNNDGNIDLFIASHPENQLYQNNGDGTFTNIAETAGVTDPEMNAMGGAWGDFDGDGDLDLYVVNISVNDGSTHDHVVNRLYQNNGDGTFTDVAESAEVLGIPELHDHHDDIEPAQEDDHEELILELGFISASWADYNLDGWLDLMVSSRDFGPVLYHNNGDGTFDYVSVKAGFFDLDDHNHENEETSLGIMQDEDDHIDFYGIEHAAWGDANNDGYLDVFFSVAVAHEHDHDHEHEEEAMSSLSIAPHQDDHDDEHVETINLFFINNGDGTFTEETEHAGFDAHNEAVTHSAIWGDYNNDGWMDLFVCNSGSVIEGTAVPQHLYRNNGDGTFTDVFAESGMTEEYYLFNAAFADIDNDGYLDILAINHPDHTDYPAGELYPNPHPIFHNNGDGTFTNINEFSDQALFETGVADINHMIGLSVADMDGDGDLDFIMTENHGDGPTLLYENINASGSNNYLTVALQGTGHNTFGYGARVEVHSGDMMQVRYPSTGSTGLGSQSTPVAQFGLGEATEAEIKIFWPGGNVESFGNLEANQFITLVEGEGTVTSIADWNLF